MKKANIRTLKALLPCALLGVVMIGNTVAQTAYAKMDYGFNGCTLQFGPLQENVTVESMAKMASATNADGFTYTPVYNYGYVILGKYPTNCKSPTNESWPLYLQVKVTAPTVTQRSRQSAPTPPAGMKVACMTGQNSPQPDGSSPTCPVISYNGTDFWPFSYEDNRLSVGLVGYKAGQRVQQLELKGTRYVWKATVEISAETVTLWGQGQGKSVSTSWDSLK